jgi:hypothetical protein
LLHLDTAAAYSLPLSRKTIIFASDRCASRFGTIRQDSRAMNAKNDLKSALSLIGKAFVFRLIISHKAPLPHNQEKP